MALKTISDGERAGKLLYLTPDRLRVHPENMRRFYPPDQVAEMADSIRANGGVLQALLVVSDPERPGCYLAVDGNLRTVAGQSLGAACPPLKCEVIPADRAGQLLAMLTTTLFHYPKDVISEALHYRRLVKSGYSQQDIARSLGKAAASIANALKWLELDEEIQELAGQGRLPRDRKVADALLSVSERGARVKLAQRLAASRAGIGAIVAACGRLREELETQKAAGESNPMLALASRRADGKTRADKTSWPDVRAAAQAMCAACDIQKDILPDVPEPAWILITHQAGDCCARCPVRGIRRACEGCPGVELLARLMSPAPALSAVKVGHNGRG